MTDNNELLLVEGPTNGVVVVTLNNPPLNLVTLELTAALMTCMSELDQRDDVRAIVVIGSGTRAFSAGSDIKEFPQVWDDVIDKKLRRENEAFNKIEFLSKPVIAAMEGSVTGGGFELAMACDLRVLSDQGRVALPEVNLGVFPGSGGIFRLPRLVGPAKAVEMMFLGEFIEADQALALGLVNRLAPAGETRAAAVDLAEQIARKPAESIRIIKQAVREMQFQTTEECFARNLEFSKAIFQTADCAEGVDAFLNKRRPRFR